jgi:hypothetical protein
MKTDLARRGRAAPEIGAEKAKRRQRGSAVREAADGAPSGRPRTAARRAVTAELSARISRGAADFALPAATAEAIGAESPGVRAAVG